jgi:WD40 repeat protein
MQDSPPSAIAQQWSLGVKINQLVGNASGTMLAAALGDGRIARLQAAETPQEPQLDTAHAEGVSLSLAAAGEGFVSGGDDGRVLALQAAQAPTILAHQKARWIDHVVSTPNGALIAYASGKTVQLLAADGTPQGAAHPHPSSIGGLAFSPNGKRLAVAHHNGVSLWWTAATTQTPVLLPWKGAHLQVLWSPDGANVITTMQENALHGWRLADMNEMRMQGYSSKISSLSWAAKGKWLFTAGSAQAVGWPFFGGGPWGKPPQALGLDRGVLVRMVAAHPRDALVAIGYADGMIELAPQDGRPGFLVHPPVAEHGHAITGLVWNAAGDCLFASTESGYIMLFTIESVAAVAKI